MELTIWSFLIVCPLVFLAGFVDAVAGGGGLISLPAYLFAGVPIHNAIATNKLSSCTGTLISTVRLCRNRYVDWPLAVPCVAMALIGSTIGARIALIVSGDILKVVLMFTLPVLAWFILRKKDLDAAPEQEISRKLQFVFASGGALAVGIYDGFYGPGTGTFLILIYTGLVKMDVIKAAGNTKLTNLASNVSALLVFLAGGYVILPLGLAASLFSIAGNYVGAGMVMKKGGKFVKVLILFVLALLFVKTIAELFPVA